LLTFPLDFRLDWSVHAAAPSLLGPDAQPGYGSGLLVVMARERPALQRGTTIMNVQSNLEALSTDSVASALAAEGRSDSKGNGTVKDKKKATKLNPSATARSSKRQSIHKSDAVITMLRRKNGASLLELQKQTGWLPHSVRGFLSGTVKAKLGLDLRSERTDKGERRYFLEKL
jgi:hypothetical protein